VQALLDAKADVNDKAKELHHVTALILASENGHLEVVRTLLDAKADVNARADTGAKHQRWRRPMATQT
jgi:ankyrin repeat protein